MKHAMTLLLILGFLMGFSTTILADAGPKPELRITLINPPDEPYVLDLLVEPDCTECWVDDDRFEGIDQALVALVEAQQSTEWVGVLTHGLSYPVFGDLKGQSIDGQRVHVFSYRVPDTFKILLVTQSGQVVQSEVLTRDTFLITVRFDALTGDVIRPTLWKQYAFQLLTTLFPTLIVETLLLVVFGLWSKRNLIVMLIANGITQVLLSLTMGITLIQAGLLWGIIVFLLMEGVVLLIEAVIYAKCFDKMHRLRRRVLYALTANFVSFFVGFVVLSETYHFLLQL